MEVSIYISVIESRQCLQEHLNQQEQMDLESHLTTTRDAVPNTMTRGFNCHSLSSISLLVLPLFLFFCIRVSQASHSPETCRMVRDFDVSTVWSISAPLEKISSLKPHDDLVND